MRSLSNKNNQFYFIKIEIEKNMLNYIKWKYTNATDVCEHLTKQKLHKIHMVYGIVTNV